MEKTSSASVGLNEVLMADSVRVLARCTVIFVWEMGPSCDSNFKDKTDEHAN